MTEQKKDPQKVSKMGSRPKKWLEVEHMTDQELDKNLQESFSWLEKNEGAIQELTVSFLDFACPELGHLGRYYKSINTDLNTFSLFMFQAGYLRGTEARRIDAAERREGKQYTWRYKTLCRDLADRLRREGYIVECREEV